MKLEAMGVNGFSMLNEHRAFLGKAFEAYLKKEIKVESPSVLSVGCGVGYEAEPILRVFPNAKYRGIDIDKIHVELARRINEDLPGNIFEIADAREEGAFAGGPWNVLILRNPQVMGEIADLIAGKRNSKDWEIIIKNSIKFLKTDGIMFITTPTRHEREIILNQLNILGRALKLLVDEENKYKTNLGLYNDDIVILAKKSKMREISCVS